MDETQTSAPAQETTQQPEAPTVGAVGIAAVAVEQDEAGEVIVSTADGSAVATMSPEAFARFTVHLAKLQTGAQK